MEIQTKFLRLFVVISVFALLLSSVAIGQIAQGIKLQKVGVIGAVYSTSVRQNSPSGPPSFTESGLGNGFSWGAGTFANFRFNRNATIQLELQYAASSYTNKRAYATVEQGKYRLGHIRLSATYDYFPFWKKRLPLSLFLGANMHLYTNYKAKIFTAYPANAPIGFRWETVYSPNYSPYEQTTVHSLVWGAKCGVGYDYRNFGVRLSYNYMLTPVLQIYRGNWPLDYYFSSTQLSVSYPIWSN